MQVSGLCVAMEERPWESKLVLVAFLLVHELERLSACCDPELHLSVWLGCFVSGGKAAGLDAVKGYLTKTVEEKTTTTTKKKHLSSFIHH